jgi:hypothetical protein
VPGGGTIRPGRTRPNAGGITDFSRAQNQALADGNDAGFVLRFPMETLLIIAAVLALILVVVVVAVWTAPVGEETEDGFRLTAPSRYQRFKARWLRGRRPKGGVGPLRSPHPMD